MILSILTFLVGLSTLVYSCFEIHVWGGLYFDRDSYCIEKFRKITKATDLVSCMHNITRCVFGFTMMLAGMRRWMPETSLGLVYSTLTVCFAFLVLDILVVEGSTRACKLRELRFAIQQQWRVEKHISPEHNHEVNLYRGTVRVTQQYPKQIIAMGACMIFLQLFFI